MGITIQKKGGSIESNDPRTLVFSLPSDRKAKMGADFWYDLCVDFFETIGDPDALSEKAGRLFDRACDQWDAKECRACAHLLRRVLLELPEHVPGPQGSNGQVKEQRVRPLNLSGPSVLDPEIVARFSCKKCGALPLLSKGVWVLGCQHRRESSLTPRKNKKDKGKTKGRGRGR